MKNFVSEVTGSRPCSLFLRVIDSFTYDIEESGTVLDQNTGIIFLFERYRFL